MLLHFHVGHDGSTGRSTFLVVLAVKKKNQPETENHSFMKLVHHPEQLFITTVNIMLSFV